MQFHLEELNQATVTLWSLSNSFVHNKDVEWFEGQFELRPKNQGQLNPNSQYRIAIEAIKGMKINQESRVYSPAQYFQVL